MKSRFTVSLAILAGVGIGAVAVQGLHAQSQPPVYFVGETEISNPDAYAKEYITRVMADIKANGGRYCGGKGNSAGRRAAEIAHCGDRLR
jgi:hypothetical protein